MEPAKTIIKRLGGVKKVAQITGAGIVSPYRWQYPRERGGTGGTIPWWYHRPLLDYARRRGIRLDAEDFLPQRQKRIAPTTTD